MPTTGSSIRKPRHFPGRPFDAPDAWLTRRLTTRHTGIYRLAATVAATLWLLLPGPVASAGPEESAEDAAPVQGTADSEPQEIAVLPEYSLLTPKGMLVVQPSIEFSHSSVNRVALEGFTIIPAITIGAIDVRRVDRDATVAALAMRYGLTSRLEFEMELPYVWRMDSTATRPLEVGLTDDKITDVDGSGFGDITGRLRYQVNRGVGSWPFVVTDLGIKSRTGKGPFEVDLDQETGLQRELPTGSGFWTIEPGVTAIIPSDPAVFFVRGSYIWTFSRDIPDFGRIDPGNVFGISLGMGFAINEKASFSLGYEHSIVGKTTQDGRTLPGSDTIHLGSLLLGASFRQDRNRTIHVSLAAGLTDDATDVRLSLRYPISVIGRR